MAGGGNDARKSGCKDQRTGLSMVQGACMWWHVHQTPQTTCVTTDWPRDTKHQPHNRIDWFPKKPVCTVLENLKLYEQVQTGGQSVKDGQRNKMSQDEWNYCGFTNRLGLVSISHCLSLSLNLFSSRKHTDGRWMKIWCICCVVGTFWVVSSRVTLTSSTGHEGPLEWFDAEVVGH